MPVDNHTIGLDLCKKCQVVWFDGGELESLPKAVAPKDDLSPEVKQQMAILKIQQENVLKAELEDNVARFNNWTNITSIEELVLRILLRLMFRV